MKIVIILAVAWTCYATKLTCMQGMKYQISLSGGDENKAYSIYETREQPCGENEACMTAQGSYRHPTRTEFHCEFGTVNLKLKT